MKLIEDLGMVYATQNSKNKLRHGIYECPVCSKHFRVATANVKRGNTTKCRECSYKHIAKKNTKHNLRHHKLYGTYMAMMARCNNDNSSGYNTYGGKGIKVAEEFLDIKSWIDYVSSLKYYGKHGYTLDRIDTSKGYEFGNLRWTSKAIQARNTSRLRKNNSSGFKGVHWCKHNKKYIAQICVNYKRKTIGLFDSPKDAGYAYDKYVVNNGLSHTTNNLYKG